MSGLHISSNSNTLVDYQRSDDAGVYKLRDDLAIVQTLDFITPVVNDPFLYGQIAAANSLSDIFAMGAKVETVLNMVAYDSCHVTKQMLNEILKGGLEKIHEAGGVLLGGHTIEDKEMKYGLSVTGVVHPKKIIKNHTIKDGDVLILTKPLGMGTLSTAIKRDKVDEKTAIKAANVMKILNKRASEIALEFGVHAMTDVTGFGLLGHLSEMLSENHTIEVNYEDIPFIEESFETAKAGIFPGGSKRNKKYFSKNVEIKRNNLQDHEILLCFDAQTSGGLLISIPNNKAHQCITRLHNEGVEYAKIIANVKKGIEPGKILLI